MSLLELTAEFVKTLNQVIPTIDNRNKNIMEELKTLKLRISRIISQTASSEGILIDFLKKQERNKEKISNYIIVRKEGELQAVISTSLQKTTIDPFEKINSECDCLIEGFETFNKLTNLMVIENLKQLFELDESIQNVCICVYDHTYRSYEGFTCFITIATPSGEAYAIDAIKFRDAITKLRLLKCGVQKMIHCRECVQRLIKDFGLIGCYRNYDNHENNCYIDWRIKPLDQVFITIMYDQMQELINTANLKISTEKYEMEITNEIIDFSEKRNVPLDCPYLAEILKLRDYLAKTHDEGVQFVLTNQQITLLLESTPTSVQMFEAVLPRMSTVLRPHVRDFILILLKRAKIFSLKKLKDKINSPEIDMSNTIIISNEPKHRSFKKKETINNEFEEVIISSDDE